MFFLGSILIGGISFYAFESKTWDFLDSLYFSFITFSTIGFGDLVPKVDLSSGEGLGKLIVMIIFMTVGR